MNRPRGDKPEPPDFKFNVHLVSMEYHTDVTMRRAEFGEGNIRALRHDEVVGVCVRLNEHLIEIGFYKGYLEGDAA